MSEYDEAIEFLQAQPKGSYFHEISEMIEQLLARVHELEAKPSKLSAEEKAWMKQASGGARYYARARGLL
tara:strand:- start:1220 stop:1429 length:210 start_codon:yes stop_codon:yes gene_type:complete